MFENFDNSIILPFPEKPKPMTDKDLQFYLTTIFVILILLLLSIFVLYKLKIIVL